MIPIITTPQVAAMLAAQDRAAQYFWAYPGDEWQSDFQSDWLDEVVGAPQAADETGRLWGA